MQISKMCLYFTMRTDALNDHSVLIGTVGVPGLIKMYIISKLTCKNVQNKGSFFQLANIRFIQKYSHIMCMKDN